MIQRIPQSTSKMVVFKAYLASDHVSEATGKTIAITISKNGGAFGNPNAGATNATEISSGWYKVTLDTTDTGTLGPLAVRGAVATIDDVGVLLEVVAATNGGLTALPDAAAAAAGGLFTRGTGAGQINQNANGQIDVNAVNWAGAATATNDVALATAPTNFASLSVDVSGQVSLSSGTLIGIWNVDTSLITPDSNIGSYVLGLATAANLATVDTVADAIKAKTDQLTFGVANVLNANITHVNEVEVTGDGETGTEWGPV